jgi:nitrogen fixation protein
MLTLQAAGLAANYSRASHLIGGMVLLAVGWPLLFRPEWLTFP